jgi:hypothetical protein
MFCQRTQRSSLPMTYYCQRRKIDDGIRLNQQPPQADCCGEPANNFIIVYGEKQWLCPWHYDDHLETRSFLYTEGENLDAKGNPL